VGLRFRPVGLRFRPMGLRFRPQGLRFRPQGIRSSVFVFDTSIRELTERDGTYNSFTTQFLVIVFRLDVRLETGELSKSGRSPQFLKEIPESYCSGIALVAIIFGNFD